MDNVGGEVDIRLLRTYFQLISFFLQRRAFLASEKHERTFSDEMGTSRGTDGRRGPKSGEQQYDNVSWRIFTWSLSPGMSPMAFWGSDGVTLCECENFFSSLVSFFNGWIDRKNGASRGRERCEKWDPLKTLKEKHQLRSIGRKK